MAGVMCGLPDHWPFYSFCSTESTVRKSVTWLMGGLPAHVAFLFSIDLLKAQKLC